MVEKEEERENETNSTVNLSLERYEIKLTSMIRSPLTKLVLTLAWYNCYRESECTSRENIESRISFDFLRSRKLFLPSDPPISTVGTTTFLALISVTESREREREREHLTSLARLKEKHTDVSPSSPIFVFFFNNRKSVEMNLSRVKGRK